MVNKFAEIDKRVLGEVYGSTETMELVTTLCDEYDSRCQGSGQGYESCLYMAEKLESYGLENVHLEKFTLPGWIRGSSKLTMLEPKMKEIECIALPVCAEGTVEAELIYLEAGAIGVYDKRGDESWRGQWAGYS